MKKEEITISFSCEGMEPTKPMPVKDFLKISKEITSKGKDGICHYKNCKEKTKNIFCKYHKF